VTLLTDAGQQQLKMEFCGLPFATPLVLLSGCVGFGEEYTRVSGFSNRDAGAVCLKGTTLEPRLGNPPHRIAETPMGMLNAIGLQNPGVDHVVRTILPALDFSETRFIANVSGSTVEEYAEVTRRFDDSPIDAIEINISCPNVKEGGVAFGNNPDMSARVVEACRRITRKPLITKLSPNQTDIRENARRCIEAGSNGLAVINTIAAIRAGATRVHGCAIGIGERVGNTPMDQLLVNLRLLGWIDNDLSALPEYCERVSTTTGVPVPPNYPVVGRDAFRTGTGVHAAAVIKAYRKGHDWLADRIYSGVPAGLVGRRQVIEVGPMSGESNVVHWLEQRGVQATPERVQAVFRHAKSVDRMLTDEEIQDVLASLPGVPST